jgi:hypothetical protein
MKLPVPVVAWRVRLQITLWRHGWAWPSAFVLALLAVALEVAVSQPARAALAATQAELARASSAGDARRATEPASELEQVAGLRTALRGSAEPAELVQRMAALADAEQIALPRGEYQQQVHRATEVTQVQVSQSLRASYPQLRRYVEAVLRAIPNASLDQVSARRDNVGQSQLDVRLRWSLWTQRPAAAGESPWPGAARADAALALVRPERLSAATQGASTPAGPARDLFAARSWTPPPAPSADTPPAPPTAPPLPFRFLGKKLEGESWEIYLARGEQTFIARTGQVIENEWRVDSIAPPILNLTYLPLGLHQTFPIGDIR